MKEHMQQEAEKVDVEAKASADKIKRSRRPTLNFLEMGIAEGSRLDFVNGDQSSGRGSSGKYSRARNPQSRNHVTPAGTRKPAGTPLKDVSI